MINLKLNLKVQANATIDLLITDFKKKDEYDFFRHVVTSIRNVNETALKKIVQDMPLEKQEFLRQVLLSHRVTIDTEKNKTMARKIVSVRGKKNV